MSGMRLVIVTGLSGAGKSVAIRQLEDSGYYCVDNLPVPFINEVALDLQQHGYQRVAMAIDARSRMNLAELKTGLDNLVAAGVEVRSLFLTASIPTLIQRFSETRRRHPLTIPGADSEAGLTLAEAVKKERELLAPAEPYAQVIDTSNLSPNTLRDWVRRFIEAPATAMTLAFESFAFKKGIPVAADLLFDVRNLPNPYYDPALRPFTGLDQPIIDFMAKQPDAQAMIDDIERFIRRWLPSYEAQNRHYLTVAIGCTGGQHRSVYVAQTLADRFKDVTGVVVRHRQVARMKEVEASLKQTA